MITLPFNIYSIEDIDTWRKHYFYPVSLDVSATINDRLCRFLKDLYPAIADEMKMHYRIATKQIYLELYDLLMKLSVADRMKSRKDVAFVLTDRRCPDDVKLPARCCTFELYRNNYDIVYPNLELRYHDPYYRKISTLKKIRQKAVDVFKLRTIMMKDARRPFLIQPNKCTRSYVRAHYRSQPVYVRPELIFALDRNCREGAGYTNGYTKYTSAIVDFTAGLFSSITGNTFPSPIRHSLERALCNHFCRITDDVRQARLFFRKIPKGIQMYTGTAKYFTRVVSEVVRENGGTVTGFPHGGSMSGLITPMLSFVELATCDRFACFDDEDVRYFQQYSTFNDVTFPCVPEMGKSPLRMEKGRFRKRSHIDLSQVNTIMYLNHTYWYDNFSYGVRDYTQGLDLQLRVMDFLLTLNKHLIFKLRPKTEMLSKNYNHFGYYNGRVEYMITPFRQILEKGDVFIFEGLGSTAMYEAMTLTDKPILLFKPPFPRCTPEFEETIRERCHVVDLYEDERNRLCFEEQKLKAVFGIDR